jgi:hypothetical protein
MIETSNVPWPGLPTPVIAAELECAAHAFAGQFGSVGVVNDAIQNRVRAGWVAKQDRMPLSPKG